MARSPTDEGPLRSEVDRAGRAKAILEHELVIEAIDRLRKKVVAEFLDTKSIDTSKLQMLALKRDVIEQFVNHFRDAINTGKFAAQQLEQSQAPRR